MLLRPDGPSAVVAIGQASHAWVSGQLAAAWAGDVPEELRLAAEQHDVGMAEWDVAPERNPATGLPYSFTELPRRTHVALWSAAPRKLLSQSRHAALLVSLHGVGLYERFPPKGLAPEDEAAVQGYLASERTFQEALIEELAIDRDELTRRRGLIALWDELSLALCLDWPPRDVGDLHVGRAGESHTLSPWPLRDDGAAVVCEGRRLTGSFDDEASLHAALAAAPRVELCFELRPG